MKEIQFFIPGTPKGKARPRITKKGITYTPKDTISYETWVKECYMLAKHKHSYNRLDGGLMVQLVVYYPILKSMSKIKRKQALEGKIRPGKKPDCDNIAKIILDALNGIAYEDDKQVVTLIVTKWYAEEPGVEVTIRGEL